MEEAQRQAASVVAQVQGGATISAAFATLPGSDADAGRRRALVQELAYGTLRHWGMLNGLLRLLAAKPIAEPALAALIAVALYQLQHTRAPAFAVVDHAVAAAARVARPAAKGLVNALLRRFLRERDALLDRASADPVARWSHPAWWIARVRREHPDDWAGILAAGNERPPLTLRANVRKLSRDVLARRFAAAGVAARPVGAAGLVVTLPQPVQKLPGFADGAFSVQDAGAQLAAPLLGLQPGLRVLDACAAPGGKTTHIAELADVDIVAVDDNPARLLRVGDNAARLGLDPRRLRVVPGDAGAPATWWDGRPFDRILADVPCTASGVVRRHPDAKWLRRERDIESFVAQQTRLLDALWPLLSPGGTLLYATCSVFRDENDARVTAFLATHPDATREAVSFPDGVHHVGGQLVPALPGADHDQDGFFYARLAKRR
ncbi:MAG: 16S rRNA (cytosine(967)-C(5))-methyltransferase RsmB [Casimicrobiaceae bacterium]